MAHTIFINGLIVNLLCHKGMTTAKALELLYEVNRIQPSHNKPKPSWPGKPGILPDTPPTLLATDAAFHQARRRIRDMERAIANCIAGRDHGIKRNKWRKEKGDPEAIFHVLGHVLSRKDPVTHEEMVEDARLFLINTGELPCSDRFKPPVTNEYAPLIVARSGQSYMTAKSMKMPDYDVDFSYQGEGTRITITLKTLLPQSMQQALEGKVEKALNGRATISHIKAYAPKEIEAANYVDWPGMVGEMKAWLVCATTGRDCKTDEERTKLIFEIENAEIN